MRIVIPGIDASQSGLGRSIPVVQGVPSQGLQGLYLFDSGEVGQQVRNFTDLSGKRNHASVFGSYTPPVQRAWGAEVQSPNGIMIETGIPVGDECTVVMAFSALLPGGESGVFMTLFGAAGAGGNLYTGDPAASINNYNSPVVNLQGTRASNNQLALFDNTAQVLGVQRPEIVGGPTVKEPSVFGLRIDGPNSTMSLRANKGTDVSVTRTSIGQHYAADRGQVMIGAWPDGAARSAASPYARLFGAAIYDRVLDNETLALAMLGVRRRAEGAGIAFA